MDNFKRLHKSIHNFIKKNYTSLENHRNFYGLSFLALSMKDNKEIINFCVENYKKLDKEDKEFHWEFNNFAWLQFIQNNNNNDVESFVKELRFKNVNNTNWGLLKLLTIYMKLCSDSSNRSDQTKKNEIIKEAKKIIRENQNTDGFLRDKQNDKSLQYHCFSLLLVDEFLEITGDVFFEESLISGVNFIKNFILPNGQSLYIGRGQEQIFGYGSLIYILGKSYKISQSPEYIYELNLVIEYILTYIRNDGSIPLVLNNNETYICKKNDVNNPHFLGWYNYNNYFDYITFFLFCLEKFDKLNIKDKKNNYFKKYSFNNKNFGIQEDEKRIYIISSPGHANTNDLSIPLVYDKELNKTITPIYGGEEYGSKLYNKDIIGTPYGKISVLTRLILGNKKHLVKHLISKVIKKDEYSKLFFRDFMNYNILNGNIVGENKYIQHKRQFNYLEDSIEINDIIEFKKDFNFLDLIIFSISGYNSPQIHDHEINFENYKVLTPNKNTLYIEKQKDSFNSIGKVFTTIIKSGKKTFKKGENINNHFKIIFKQSCEKK